ncbi:MAG: DUF5678 domain-containing protein [Kiritimatiellales bacterium]|nr:DUF5678 domain-containing protein [Kiritimatiellales bacterium]
MHFKEEHAGKWVATKNDRVIDSGKTLESLRKKISNRKDTNEMRFALIPKRCIAGYLHGI